ncbi:MAG TPA: OmpA family protein [Bacteroidales bacterium]|nr:OmpA family protein [Bacteroidales bacterium]
MLKNNKNILLFLILLNLVMFSFAQDENPCIELANKKAKKVYNEAFENFRNRRFVDASAQFKEVLEYEPQCGQCYFFLGMINFKKADYNLTAAQNYFEKSVEICPDFDVYVYYYLGQIYYGAEKWELAEQALKKFLKDPEKIENDAELNDASAMYKWAAFYNKAYNNPVPFNPRYIRGVSSASDEYIPSISPDGEYMFYVRVIELPPNKNDLVPKPVFKEKFYYSEKKNGQYDNGKEMPYPFNVNDHEGGATLTIDNNELYYSVRKYKGSYFNGDIYFSKKDESGTWGEIEPVENINNPDTWESMPSISSDGKTLYFVSDRPGGIGGLDLYRSVKGEDGVWGKPENLGPQINTKNNEKTPFLHTDSQTLYFSSDSPDLMGLGGFDIYYSRIQADGSWKKPANLGYPINSAADDAGFFVSLDGKTAFFSSTKLVGVGGWDVYEFDLYADARPEEMKLVKGDVKDETTEQPLTARIEIKNVETKKITKIPVDSLTGKYVIAINTRDNFVMTVKKDDYAYESKLIPANINERSEAVQELDFEIKPIEVGQSYKLNDIYFASNSFELNHESEAILDGFIEFLTENPKIKTAIHGHTDNIGKDEDNMLLSDNRSKSVYNYLTEHGIAASRLSYKGFGETKPVADNDTEAGRAKNRRTEFVILEK